MNVVVNLAILAAAVACAACAVAIHKKIAEADQHMSFEALRAPGRLLLALLAAVVLVALPRPAAALEVNGGVSAGGIMAGVVPRLAISPHVGLSWRTESGFLFEAYDVLSILPVGSALGVGVYNQTSTAIGYTWKDGAASLGPSLAIYRMPACGRVLCGRVVGLGPGGQAEGSYYFWGALGLSIHANMAWIGGKSSVLPGGVAAMVVVGPVLRWRSE